MQLRTQTSRYAVNEWPEATTYNNTVLFSLLSPTLLWNVSDQAHVMGKTLRKCKSSSQITYIPELVFILQTFERQCRHLNTEEVNLTHAVDLSWANQISLAKNSTVSVTEMGDLFASARCHFRCMHHAITALEEHDRPTHSPAHSSF